MTQVDDLAEDIRTIDGKHELGAGELAEKLIELGWSKKTLSDVKLDYGTKVEVLVRGDWVPGYINGTGPGGLLDVVHDRGNWSGYAKGSSIRLAQNK